MPDFLMLVSRNLVAPVVRGAENIPDGAVEQRACLFVGNHTRFGLYDLPFLMYELYLRGHKVCRTMDASCRKCLMRYPLRDIVVTMGMHAGNIGH